MSDERPPHQDSDGPGLDFGAAPAQPAGGTPALSSPYRVLARKYRPATFDALIGQDVLVRTLTNAFALNRVHQAYMLTGTRGVGKTTTARILARAFNYLLPGKIEKPSVMMPELGVHCQAIIESRHVDVIEMDAASHTGIDDIREIIESARYHPVSARIKVYIIDEVHMLSKAAFNGLLKTLEEPPPHVKFIFATTEIDKVPITVRSRCLRFDLKRVEADVLIAHLARICGLEGVEAVPEALAMIARAAEGSVRDALSLLDQAIAHGASVGGAGAPSVEAEHVRDMLGLADRARIIDLFEAVMAGQIATALALMKGQHDLGADPAQILTELAEFTHFVTRVKIAPAAADDQAMTAEERARGAAFAQKLGIRALTRAWQLLLKGLVDLKDAPKPAAAADMVLVRLAHAADLPTLDEALRLVAEAGRDAPAGTAQGQARTTSLPAPPPRSLVSTGGGGAAMHSVQALAPQGTPRAPAAAPAPAPAAQPGLRFASLADVIAQAQAARDIKLKIALENDVRLVRFEPGRIEFSLVEGASSDVAALLMRRLQEWTGTRWMVAVASTRGAPSVREQARVAEEGRLAGVRADPLVRSVLDMFPGAEITAVRDIGGSETASPAEGAIDDADFVAEEGPGDDA